MTNEEWLERCELAHRASTSYKDSNLRSQWEDNIRMFKNKHPRGSKYNTELYRKRSRLFRPKVRSSSISFDAALSTAFFSTSELARLTPERKGDELGEAGASVLTDALSYHLTKTIPWNKLVVGAGQEAWKMGDVVSHQGWEYGMDSDGNVTRDQPVVTLIPAENICIDDGADWQDPMNSSPYVIWIDHMYVIDILDRVDLGDKGKMAGWLPVTMGEIQAARDFRWDSVTAERSPNQVQPKQDSSPLSLYDKVPVHKNFIREGGVDYVYYTLATRTMLSEPIPVTEEYPQGRPFVQGNLLITPHVAYHEGIPELVQPLQEEINYVANDRVDNVHLVLNKRYFGKRGRNTDFRSLLRNIPGSITMMDDPEGDVKIVETSDVTQSAYVEQDKLNIDFDDLAGTFSPSTILSQSKQPESVGGMGAMQSGPGAVTEFMLRNFRESWVENVIRQLVVLIAAFQDEESLARIVRNQEALTTLSEADQSVEEFLASFRVEVNVGISATNPSMRVEKLLYAIGAIQKLYESTIATRLELDEITAEIFGQLGYRDGARFFKEDGDDPRVSLLEQQLQEVTAKLESKISEIEAKNSVDREKLQWDKEKYAEEAPLRAAERAKVEADAQKVFAEIEETMANIETIYTGTDDTIELAKLQFQYDKLAQQQYEFSVSSQNVRDEMLVGWRKTREELAAKLEITLANSGGTTSKDVATTDPKELKDKDE